MIISTKKGTPAAELERIIREFESKGLSVTMIRGTDYNVFGLVGDTTILDEKQIRANIDYYRANAKIISDCLDELGIWYTGGKNSPYIWLKCPNGMKSWEFFDYLLENAQVVGTPGSGFGTNGEGLFRLTAFGTEENTRRACDRIRALLGGKN